MSVPVIKTSFAAGELTPSLNGRVDLAKYQVGAAVMRNFFVDFRGGASTRPGTQHVGRCRLFANQTRPCLLPFVFNSEQSYMLELNNNRMRVIFRGAYVTETAFSIVGGTTTDPLIVTIPGNNFVVGDLIFLDNVNGLLRPNGISGVNGRTFYVEAVVGSTVTLSDVVTNTTYGPVSSATWTPYISGGTAARVFETTTPWNSTVLFDLKYVQSADVMTVNCLDFPTQDIKRLGHADWVVEPQTYGSTLPPPTSLTATPQGTGAGSTQVFFFSYAVTSVDADGRESLTTLVSCENKALDQTLTPVRCNLLQWNVVPGALKYRVYKAQPAPLGLQGSGPYFYGVVANVFENRFLDVNFAPDFTSGPPIARNPFEDTGIASVNILTGGQGYVSPQLVLTDPGGSGAQIVLAADLSATAAPYGEIIAGTVIATGSDYSAPVASIVDTAPLGSGLTLAFSGAWVANPLGTGFMPAPGSITITSGGANYHQNNLPNYISAVASTPSGTNVLLIDVTGVINGIVTTIGWGNEDVTPVAADGLSTTNSATLTFTTVGVDIAASGATAEVSLGGNTNPRCCAYLQQRRAFGGSRRGPTSMSLSRPAQFTNFNVSDPIQDDDAITIQINATELNIITSMVAASSGLVVFTSGGAYLVQGDGNGVTPTSLQASPQAFDGAQDLQPLRISNQIIYAQARGSGVAELSFNFYTSQFTSINVSVLSGHLLKKNKITQWTYASEPDKIVWAVRDDGILLSLTYLKEQEVYGWARHDTQGDFVSVGSIPEENENGVYFVVRRYTPDLGYTYSVERLADRDFGSNPAANIPSNPEDAWCVDGGARYALSRPNTSIVEGVQESTGSLYAVTIIDPGNGYVAPIVEIYDTKGSGGAITVTQFAGQLDTATITIPGDGYQNPTVTVRDIAGTGAVLSVRVVRQVAFITEDAVFSLADVGKTIRVRGGKGEVLSVSGGNRLTCDMTLLPAGMPNYHEYRVPQVPAGEWSLTAAVSAIGGLDHLNGSLVQTVVDGSVQAPRVVVDGCVTLDEPGTAVIVGQGFTAQLQTMRLEAGQTTMQGRRKGIPVAVVRGRDMRGLQIGQDWRKMTEMKERQREEMGQPIVFQQGGQLIEPLFDNAPVSFVPLYYEDRLTHTETKIDEDGQVCIQQSWPLPASILAIVPFVFEGDTVR